MDKHSEENPGPNTSQLTPLPAFKKSGRCPLEPYHLIFHHKKSLVDSGAFVKFGKRWLIDEERFFQWLRENGSKGSHSNI